MDTDATDRCSMRFIPLTYIRTHRRAGVWEAVYNAIASSPKERKNKKKQTRKEPRWGGDGSLKLYGRHTPGIITMASSVASLALPSRQ